MTDLVLLTETIVKSLVKDPDSVSVKEFETDEDYILIQIMIDKEAMGSIIGREGRIANAIRTVVQAASFISDNKKVRINIDSF
ncbi:MAG: KH domain-containing protein [Bacilli bacterium]|nr:KH domain-containing protein [Bacilli bacterium]MDD3305011.1 KH domain-containing protein [Bacilli bacterium]MDD4053658.1 KH domain-containing protein [Bacilli bacterium]MDD4411157.1 KH domain-containing protein [Bacilli bacterium]